MIAANFDYVFILQSMNRNFSLRRLERYLALAWQSGASPVIVLTKADLAEDRAALGKSPHNEKTDAKSGADVIQWRQSGEGSLLKSGRLSVKAALWMEERNDQP